MKSQMKLVSSLVCVLMAVGALPVSAGQVPEARSEPVKCRSRSTTRIYGTQGTLLWGTWQTWKKEGQPADEGASVLVSVHLGREAGAPELRGGRLVGADLVGSVLRGENSSGQPVEVVICGAEPSPGDPDTVQYQIEAWNHVAKDWENPCVATAAAPNPRAVVLAGTWDVTGSHHADARKVTFACETGALGKCAVWGYKPWANVNGQSLADVHQACTRMVRADYCGNGRSHTRPGTLIDYSHDPAGVASRTTEATVFWDPAKASFEAAWAPDGATCLSRTREGQALDEVLQECPGRFKAATVDLGDGDQCLMQRSGPATPLLRNRSMPKPGESTAQTGASGTAGPG